MRTPIGIKEGEQPPSDHLPRCSQVPSIIGAHGMQARRCNPPAGGVGVGCTDRASALARGSSSTEHRDAAPGDVQLSPGAVRAEKLIATLDLRQDHARAGAECLSPASVRVHCEDWGLGDVLM